MSALDARRAGYPSIEAALADLQEGPGRELYRVRFHHAGEDPRPALGQQADLSADEVAALVNRLDRLDRASPSLAWTRPTLALINRRPATVARELAAELGCETAWFKPRIRRLKALGLTESLEVGYRLTPRGRALLQAL